jgi:hypothetical protein
LHFQMGRVQYEPKAPLSHPAAADYLPHYLYDDFTDPSGVPDVRIRDDFYGTRRKLRIGILGAGTTCINFLHFAEERLKDVDIVVYEKNEDVGGVVRVLHLLHIYSLLNTAVVAY